MNDFGLKIGKHNTVAPTLGNGEVSELQLNENGLLLVKLLEPTVVTATDLDIRDLNSATDSVTVVASDLDVRDLAFATDKVDASGSEVSLDAATLAALESISVENTVTVQATDLDIRDLSSVTDSVTAIIPDTTTETYIVTDTEAINADGLVTITGSGTPWIDACSQSVGVGQILDIYGIDWTCDQNAQARLIILDGADIVVLKHSLNTSSMPDQAKFFNKDGRIEVVGGAAVSVKIQIKKRAQAGGDALGFASIHARLR